MRPTIKFDHTGWNAAAKRLLAAKKVGVEKLIRQQARLFVRDCLKMTPPFGNHAVTESFSVQRKTGEAAVARDIHKVFRGPSSLAILKDPKNPALAAALTKAIRSRDIDAVTKILDGMGLQWKVTVTPSDARHKATRNRRGRVRDGITPTLVLDERALKRFTKGKVADVGKTKSGWKRAVAMTGGASPPAWISRHSTPGIAEERGTSTNFAITVGNLVSWYPGFSDLRIINAALQNRVRSMRKEADMILFAQMRKARR